MLFASDVFCKPCCYLCRKCPHSKPGHVMTRWQRVLHWWHDDGYGHNCRHLNTSGDYYNGGCLDCPQRWASHDYEEWR